MIRVGRENYENKLLKGKTKETVGILTEISAGGIRSSKSCKLVYFVKHKKYTAECRGDLTFLKPGDSVRIMYSVVDNSVSTVVNRYYYIKPTMKWVDEE